MPHKYLHAKGNRPSNWKEAADEIKSRKPTGKKSTSVVDRLTSIEKLLKERKHV